MSEDLIGEGVLIRYDGLDADRHEIDLAALAESLKGLSRIIGVAGNFVATDRYVQHKDAFSVKVVARPPEAHCFELLAFVKWTAEQPLISGTMAGLLVALITYIFKRAAGQREEMRAIKDSLDKAIKELGTRDQSQVDRLLSTIDKMADALRPAAKQAVSPIGQTASSLTIGSTDHSNEVKLTAAERDAILSETEAEIGDEKDYVVTITELDMETGSCRVSLADDPETRVSGRITDPAFGNPNNSYATAMAAKRSLTVRAKATVREGAIDRLYISDSKRPT